jgi:hypothetical protein
VRADKIVDGPSPLARLVGDGERPLKVVPFPGPRGADGATVGLWCLSHHETVQARVDALKYLGETLKLTEVHLAGDTSLGEEEGKIQILFRALRDPAEPLRPFASSPMQLRSHLTSDEREALFGAYLEWTDERSPIRKIYSDAELDEVVAALGKGSTRAITLSYFDTASLRSIVLALVDRCATLTKPRSSATSPASDSSPFSALAD